MNDKQKAVLVCLAILIFAGESMHKGDYQAALTALIPLVGGYLAGCNDEVSRHG